MRTIAICVALFGCACAASPCGVGRQATLGGSAVCVYGPTLGSCPAGLPARWDLEGAVVCGGDGFDVGAVTDAECEQAGVACVPAITGCDGERPALETCTRGPTWGECGGIGSEPIFACFEGGSGCRWFAGGCAPVGFVASRCSASDLCCVDGYPFGAMRTGGAGYLDSDYSFVYGWGSDAWDRLRERNLDVTLAPLAPIAAPAVSCTPSGDSHLARGPCAPGPQAGATLDHDVVTLVAITPSVAILFWRLWVEVMRDADGTLHARACRAETTDFDDGRPCDGPPPICASAGTVTIETFPTSAAEAESMRIDLSATFPDGTTIDASF